MSDCASALDRIRTAAETAGLVRLAKEAGVPYTTVHAFHKRGWTHKNLKVIDKLSAAAERIAADGGA